MKSMLTREKSKKTGEKGITLIALVVTIIVLLILAGVSIMMLTGQNGILRRAEEAGTSTAHAEVYEILNLQTVDYMTESKLGEYSGTLIDYLSEKEYITETDDEGKYKINVEKLLGQKGKYGNGEGDIDVYKLEEVLPETGRIEKVATKEVVKIAATETSKTYNVVYYGKSGSTPIPLGKLIDNIEVAISDYSARLYEYYKNMNDTGVEGENVIDDFPAKYLFYEDRRENYSDYVEYRSGIYKVEYTDEGNTVKGVKKVQSNMDITKFGVYQVDGMDVLVTPSTPDYLVHKSFSKGNYEDEEGRQFEGYCASDSVDYTRYYDMSGMIVREEFHRST